jgi:hypothetical protein
MIKDIFRFITCKDRLPTGTWRLLIALSIPPTLFLLFPGVIFWIIVHIVMWIREGYDEDKGVSIKKSNPIKLSESKLGVCKKCNANVGYFNLSDGLCEECIAGLKNEIN